MIRRELKNRLINLEERIAATAQAKRDEVDAPVSNARMHAIMVAAVALYGEPKIDEPLWDARLRMQENLTKEFAAEVDELWRRKGGEEMHPDVRVLFLYGPFMFSKRGGRNDNLRFERIFSKAPAWLLKFTAVEWDAKLLGFKLPKLVGTPELGREARIDRNCWPFLPMGTIDAGGPCSEPDESWEKIVERRCQGRYP
jgi:hypothetical protein